MSEVKVNVKLSRDRFEQNLAKGLACSSYQETYINPLNPELNLICPLLALLGAHHILHVSRIRAKLHLPSAGIIRSSPYSPLWQGKG